MKLGEKKREKNKKSPWSDVFVVEAVFFFHYIPHDFFYFALDFSITGSPKALYKPNSAGVIQQSNPFLQRQTQAPQQNGVMPVYGGGAEKCARCSKSVYLAEKKVAAGRVCISHRLCPSKIAPTMISMLFRLFILVASAVKHAIEN